MRVGILSDTHDQVERTAGAVVLLREQGAEILIHCGDLTSSAVVHACSGIPCYYVLGNNDYETQMLERAITLSGGTLLGWSGLLELGGKRVGVTHGHLAREFRQLIRARPDYLLFGHTHQAMDETDGPIRQINPGALHRARNWTVALLDLSDDTVEFHSIR